MPSKISRRRHMKKVLDRWENEGGSLLDNRNTASRKAPPNKRSIKCDGLQIKDGPKTDRQLRDESCD